MRARIATCTLLVRYLAPWHLWICLFGPSRCGSQCPAGDSEKPSLDPSLLLWEVFVFTCTGPPDWAICLHSELWALDVNFYPAVSVCLGQKTWPPVRTQVTKQGCFKKLRAPLWRRCESWHRTSAALKTGFRTERSLRSAGWMEKRHQMF